MSKLSSTTPPIVPLHIQKFYWRAWHALGKRDQAVVRQMAHMASGREQKAHYQEHASVALKESGLVGDDGVLYPDTIYVLSGGK